MKKFITVLIILLSIINSTYANGVGIIDATLGIYFTLLQSEVEVNVENQIATVKTSQIFKNQFNEEQSIKYAFPLPEGASAVQLRWFYNGIWKEALIAASPQDTTLPGTGGEIDPALNSYLGGFPLYFDIEGEVGVDSTIKIELTYVQLLHYEFGNVKFTYPNDYTLVQSGIINYQSLNFNLTSARTIENIQLLSHNTTAITNNGTEANVKTEMFEISANQDYNIVYSLSLDELGLFGFSTSLADSLIPDQFGNGYFAFIAEPDPTETTDVINKVFTLIIDRSGSMGGDKIVQARNAASFITENLNEGDKFNIVDFSGEVTSFRNEHIDYNTQNESLALDYISNISSGGGTNISGAFQVAIPQFSGSNDNTANIIIFFTDGQATSGITDTDGILNLIESLTNQVETDLMINTFGIGAGANQQLLALIAAQNYGISEFLGDNQLEEVITNFYLQIRNPVLLNTQMTFTPDVIEEVYPVDLPNLYKGQQMIVAGRYTEPTSVTVTLTGEAFGNPVEYQYTLDLSSESEQKYQFLPKIWAKKKIEHLIVQYYLLDSNSPEAELLKDIIVELSIAYGIITEFTSFSGGDITDVENEEEFINEEENLPADFQLIGNYPNPFNPSTTIRLAVGKAIYQDVEIRIYNSLGELVKVLTLHITGKGMYEIMWDGKFDNGVEAPSDIYIYTVYINNTMLSNKMILMK